MTFKTILAAAVATIALVAPANAATYLLEYTATGGPAFTAPTTAKFTITTSDTLNMAGGYDILTAAGNFKVGATTTTVTGLAPLNPPGFFTDNVFFNANPAFNGSGLGVSFAGGFANLWGNAPSNYSFYTSLDGSNYPVATDGTLSVTRVPEPASWALLIVGFGMVGVAARRRKAIVVA
jgi:hypothetical protein